MDSKRFLGGGLHLKVRLYFPVTLPARLSFLQGVCTSCNEDRLRVSGRCVTLVYCKGRRIQSGSMLGQNCRCLNDHCQYCNRAVSGDVCRVVSGTSVFLFAMHLAPAVSLAATRSLFHFSDAFAQCRRTTCTRVILAVPRRVVPPGW